ncbi:MAG: hypothetical protein KAT86_06670 [Candidatus Latescibacteria bacterium]|nr:hypothetical protein [Candidatus Latescibacterota bacterium]
MLKIFSVVVTLLIPQVLLSYDSGMLNLEVPTDLEQRQAEFIVQHRFYGKITEEPVDTFLGMDMGANVGVGLRYAIREKFEFDVSHTRIQKEYTIGLSYAYVVPEILQGQAEIQFFSFKPGTKERKRGIFSQLSWQSEPVLKRLTPVVNIGYDGYSGKAGLGLGVDVGIFEGLSMIGEYFPVLYGDDQVDCFAFGFRIRTYGHRFMFLLGNSSEIGTRRLMLGTNNRDLYFGFNIHRLLLE